MAIANTLSALDVDRYDLSSLTDAERLFLWRHRQLNLSGRMFGRAGPAMGQDEAAREIGLSHGAYRAIETGRGIDVSPAEVARTAESIEDLEPTLGELCRIARRRSGELLVDVYDAVGYSRPYYLRLERAGDPRVVAHWEGRGFRFPER